MEFSVNWTALSQVFVASLGFSLVIVAAFAIGVRFTTSAKQLMQRNKKPKSGQLQKEFAMRAIAYLAFTVCAAAVLYEVYLIVPYFHLAK